MFTAATNMLTPTTNMFTVSSFSLATADGEVADANAVLAELVPGVPVLGADDAGAPLAGHAADCRQPADRGGSGRAVRRAGAARAAVAAASRGASRAADHQRHPRQSARHGHRLGALPGFRS